MKKAGNKILIVYPWSHLDTNPTMILLLQELIDRGFLVDVFCRDGDLFPRPKNFDGNVRYIFKSDLFYKVFSARKVVTAAARLRRLPQIFSYKQKYCLIIGVNPAGLILASELNKRAKQPMIYISFEILFGDELSLPWEIAFKEKEIQTSKGVSIVLIQDEERAHALANENGFSDDQFVLVPNAPSPMRIPSSNYLREELKIPSDQRIILYAGSMAGWASRDFMEEMVRDWPSQYVLVLHSRARPNERMKRHLERLEKTGKIYISRNILSQDRLLELIASADFGLAPYRPTPDEIWSGKNIYHIGYSSGKVAYFAMCGLPIIARDLPVYRKGFTEYDCGRVYLNTSAISQILNELDRNYDHHSQESKRFYEERLKPVKPMKDFCDRLCEIA